MFVYPAVRPESLMSLWRLSPFHRLQGAPNGGECPLSEWGVGGLGVNQKMIFVRGANLSLTSAIILIPFASLLLCIFALSSFISPSGGSFPYSRCGSLTFCTSGSSLPCSRRTCFIPADRPPVPAAQECHFGGCSCVSRRSQWRQIGNLCNDGLNPDSRLPTCGSGGSLQNPALRRGRTGRCRSQPPQISLHHRVRHPADGGGSRPRHRGHDRAGWPAVGLCRRIGLGDGRPRSGRLSHPAGGLSGSGSPNVCLPPAPPPTT